MEQKIPKVVYQTFTTNNLPKQITDMIAGNKKRSPSYHFKFYNGEQRREFIKDNFDERVLRAYDDINESYGAVQADLWRYCILYKLGGVYVDIKSYIKGNLKDLIKPQDECILDIPRKGEKWRELTGLTHEQWVLMFAPNHPYLKEVIDSIVNNIEARWEPVVMHNGQRWKGILTTKHKILNLSGPDAFTRAIRAVNKRGITNHRCVDYLQYFIHHLPGYDYKEMYKINGKKHYSELNLLIYKPKDKQVNNGSMEIQTSYKPVLRGETAEQANTISYRKFGDWYIPKLMHLTFKNDKLPTQLKHNLENNRKKYPDFKERFYDDNAVDRYIKDNFEDWVYNAYRSINPVYGAMKADFFRYCVLYKDGGVYMDIKTHLEKPLKTIITKDDVCILDDPRYMEEWRQWTRPTYEQWLLIFAPKHPYLISMINLMCDYILNKFEPTILHYNTLTTKQKILNVTGPDALALAIEKHLGVKGAEQHRHVNYFTFVKHTIPSHNYHQMYKMNGMKHYSEYNEPLYK